MSLQVKSGMQCYNIDGGTSCNTEVIVLSRRHKFVVILLFYLFRFTRLWLFELFKVSNQNIVHSILVNSCG